MAKEHKLHCVKSVSIQDFSGPYLSGVQTEYGKILRISPYSVQMWKNMEQKIFEYDKFSSSATLRKIPEYLWKPCVFSNSQTKKIGEITLFYAVLRLTFSKKFFFRNNIFIVFLYIIEASKFSHDFKFHFGKKVISRGEYRTAATSKMEHFVIIVNG